MAVAGLALAGGAAPVLGQSVLDGFDPNANGMVQVVVVQPDGKILIGGNFTTLSPNGGAAVTRNFIARLNTDGTLDAAFNPNADAAIDAIAVQADGKILVGGGFTSVGGEVRNHIARLDAVTGLADSFDPNANNPITSIAVQSDGRILAGGYFNGSNSIGGQTRNHIARLDPATGLADSFDPNANDLVLAITVETDGKILVGGYFNGPNSIGGQTRNRIARLDASTGMADPFDPNADAEVFSIAVQADGKILAGGGFSHIGGQTRNAIARLDPATGLADSFDPSMNSIVFSIAVQADGKILAGGLFTSVGAQTRHHMARLDATTGMADSFDPNAGSYVVSVAVQPDGKILMGGPFLTLAPNGGAAVTRNHIARVETDGRLDWALDAMLGAKYIWATAVEPDGKILIAGAFTSVMGVERNNIARLNSDGTLDNTFDPNANDWIYSLAVQPDGKILAGGFFTSIGGQTRNHIARLDPATGGPDSFDPNANMVVYSLAVQADNKILVGGAFTNIGGQMRSRIARLDGTTGMADSFNPNAGGFLYPFVFAILVQADAKILIGGDFRFIGGQTRNHIARLDPITGLADAFDPNANATVGAIAVQADGKVLAGGDFHGANSIGGQMRNHIARLDAVTGAADSFDPNADSTVNSIVAEADGKIVAGGLFATIGGQPRNYIARLDGATGLADAFNPNPSFGVISVALLTDGKVLVGGAFTQSNSNPLARFNNDTAALQDLVVTRDTITWTRGGASSQFARVVFESSGDNVNYTFLGNGTVSGTNWTLNGLNLPTGVNFFTRARGYYRTGFRSGSQSISESVRNAFISTLPTVISAVSRKIHGGAGILDVNLPLTGTPGIECRSGGATNDYTMVVTFGGNVMVTGSPQAEITLGTGCVGNNGSCTGNVTVSGNVVTIPLTNIANAQRIHVRINGVNSAAYSPSSDFTVPMSLLVGDTNANGMVNAADVAQTKARLGESVDGADFRSDLNASGNINAADAAIVKQHSGTSLPP